MFGGNFRGNWPHSPSRKGKHEVKKDHRLTVRDNRAPTQPRPSARVSPLPKKSYFENPPKPVPRPPGRLRGVPIKPGDLQVAAPASAVVVSAVLSIHNRAGLLRRAMDGYLWQTMPPEKWEIVLVDDMSTQDVSIAYRRLAGKMNIRHVRVDHTRHRVFRRRNPGWQPGLPQSWYHTPAITTNLGCRLAVGSVICLCHPEILHGPKNFEFAAARLSKERAYLFGTTYLGTQEINRTLDADPGWTRGGWDNFLAKSKADNLKAFRQECYWYTSFLPRAAVVAAGGVDFEYLNGVAAEDDDFRERIEASGWPPVHDSSIEGFHQDHSDEREKHRRRDTREWQRGLEANRRLYEGRKRLGFPAKANHDCDWSAAECFVSETRYTLGKEEPEILYGGTQ